MDEAARQELGRRMTALVARDPQIRAAMPEAAVGAVMAHTDVPLAQGIATLAQGYAERPALAMRALEFVTDESGRTRGRLLPRYDTITYGEMWRRVAAVAADWYHDARSPVRAGDFVALLGFTSSDYTVLDLACTALGTVTVPLQTGAHAAQLTPIVAETAPRVLAASVEQLDTAVDLVLANESPRTLIVFDHHPQDDEHRAAVEYARARLSDRPVAVRTFAEVLARGAELPEAPLHTGADEDALALLVYTSGSTGTPKGAIYPERMVARMWRNGVQQPFPSIGFSFMPMSHIAGRGSLVSCLGRGGTVYFAARSDMSTLFEDLALARPTVLFFVPRVCDMLFQRYRGEVDRRVAAGGVPETVEREVTVELRDEVLGGRFIMAISGSAPLPAQLHEFMAAVLGFDLIDGYGSTESAGGIMVDNMIVRPPVTDYKLIDVPELGYFGTDKPYPRGELLVKSETLIPGYFKRPDLNAEIFDAEGFYRTGDIMAEHGPDHLMYLDRRNNVLKLSQGEFVTIAKLEAGYAASPLVDQIYVYGSSERAYLLAVVVPTPESVVAHPDPADLTAAIIASLQRVAQADQLNSYEIPRAVLLETEPFTLGNGLLSGVGKLLRPKLKARYGERLEQLYADLAREQDGELAALRRAAPDLPVLETVGRAARALLGCASDDLRPDVHFTDLGGDSLSALTYSTLLQEIFGVEVPVGVIVGPATDLAALARYIEAERASGGERPTVATVHGTGTRIHAADLTLDKFIDRPTLDAAVDLPRAAQTPATVLLTGANGYLGRFLCLEWLQRLDVSGGRLICVVRGADPAVARARLDEVFDTGDPDLVRHYHALAERSLEVLPGDISEPDLGVGEQEWRRLAETVDLIVHPAALVNHVLPYGQLFGPNVVGTAEVIRLALTATIKPVTYLSTVAVAAQIAPGAFTEDGDIRQISATRSVDDGYANGYGNSKWAGEVLLREAHELCGLPVAVFRSDMILAHSRYAGQLNVPDVFTRLLLSLLATGIAPKSFYTTDSRGDRQRSHYDGLPADFTASAITALGAAVTTGLETFDVLNPHDDGISLDQFVDWLIEAGHAIERIEDYGEWFGRFETAVRALPEDQRRDSLLPLLHAYRVPGRPQRGAALPAAKFRAAVQAAELGPEHDIPHLDRALIEKYASDLNLRKLL